MNESTYYQISICARTFLYNFFFGYIFGYCHFLHMHICSFIVLNPFLYHQGTKFSNPLDVNNLLSSQISSDPQNVFEMSDAPNHSSDKYLAQHLYKYGFLLKLESITKSAIRESFTIQDIDRLSQTLKNILHK